MKMFHYPLNHKADEAYMARMCHQGWAATRLVEGVWTFEPCRPDQYVYRVGYLRGKSRAEVAALKAALAARGIAFVSRYSFWAIFRSEQDFHLYTPAEERALCEKICRPMRMGSVVSALAFAGAVWLAAKVSPWFWALALPVGVYAVMCVCLGVSYTRLIRRLRGKRP